jgi:DNA helicase-2/ATP-dependent DNA helicase PcrA
MTLLAGDHKNVCVVGDEDQSIYSWRGADIRNILEFEKDFPNAKTIRLEQNYRSTQVILEGAGTVVANNSQRKGKNLWTAREGGAKIGYYEAPDGENEALFIADYVQKYLRKAGEDMESPRVAVLYRTNSQSRLVEEALRRYNVQYTMVGGFSFYERAEIKDLLSYLKLVKNPDDSIALQRVINTPARGIGKTTMDTLERLALETGTSTWTALGHAVKNRLLPARACSALESFQRLIDDARAMLAPGFAEKLAADVAGDAVEAEEADTDFSFGAEEEESSSDTSFDFGAEDDSGQGFLDLGPAPEPEELPLDAVSFNPFLDAAPKRTPQKKAETKPAAPPPPAQEPVPGFRIEGDKATLPELIRFLIDRSGYVRSLEEEGTPESFSRIENLKELANAAHDAEERGETLDEFLDHAALVSDTDQYNSDARVTLMTLHAAKGLEFSLVLLAGMEEGLFPHSRSINDPTGLEEERRLCYVGMTRASKQLFMNFCWHRQGGYQRGKGVQYENRRPSQFLLEAGMISEAEYIKGPKASLVS